MALDKKAQVHPIGAEDSGVVDRGVVEAKEVEKWGILVGVDRDMEEEEEEEVEMPILILWRVTSVGCMAIWPVTILAPVISRRPWEVAIPALPVEHSPNPSKKAQEDVAEVARCDLGPSICCMMRTGIHIPWMMQVSCTSPLNSHRMLVMVSLRRKIQKVQKTEKILR